MIYPAIPQSPALMTLTDARFLLRVSASTPLAGQILLSFQLESK